MASAALLLICQGRPSTVAVAQAQPCRNRMLPTYPPFGIGISLSSLLQHSLNMQRDLTCDLGQLML